MRPPGWNNRRFIPCELLHWDKNSWTIGWEVRPCPDPTFLILEVRRPPKHTGRERLLGDQRGVMPKKLYPQASWLEFILAKRSAGTHRGPQDKQNTASEPGKAEWLVKGDLEEMSHKRNSNCQEGVTQGLFLWVCLYVSTCIELFSS